ncbi:AraC family transcriptional regulator [Flavobacterium sp. SH_e]|uniref:AraC family transcriptional regulator n=1 Tax=Flavobacterium TaxID=237 RepID=UPI0021E431A6|nr:AraC family transcriptional regulator [Flavobacterium sp. SH_e]MCV2484336.1 AraC family transcriptional regulator [Flavobacterium sp. SH_e]
MLKDLINSEINGLFSKGVAVYAVKEYWIKFSSWDSFQVRYPAVLLMKSGRFKIRSGETVHDLKAHDLLIFPKKSHCSEMEGGEKLRFYLIRLSSLKDRTGSMNLQADSLFFLKVKDAVKISLEASDYLVLSLICRLLHAEEMNQISTDFELELRRISTNLLLFELKLIYSKYFAYGGLHISRAEKLAVQFLTVLSIHCRKHHTVKFYAGVLYVTSGYLNRVVKQVTGKPAKKMITDAVLAEAVNLLEDSVFTIAEIAEELQFSSPSAFDIFFKKLMSCTPSEYRAEAAERFKSR